ncbi:MAG: amino acid ABC transporter permease [Propionibacteriaceae bacterium]|jgi:His/Glu/Gln/Arg/opine family amino acid ABC transporter permease subunit|nr:amino acid ABC transporter permease [Propionibacteriaceae bacterium]
MDFGATIQGSWQLLLQGLWATVLVSVLAIGAGIVVGFVLCLMILSKFRVLRALAGVYVWVIRGTPMLVQAFIVYFGVPQLVRLIVPGFTISTFVAGGITLTVNASAYLSEIFRSGINAVDPGQVEAARSLGLSGSRTMARIILPQAVRITIPSLVNQFIITIKDSSLLSVIGMAELVNKARVYVGATYNYFATYILVAVLYLAVISVLMVVSRRVERRLNRDKDSR